MKKTGICIVVTVLLTCCMAGLASAGPKDGEKAFLADLKKAIPPQKIVSVDDLHKTWQAILEGKSNAIIIDVRTRDEFSAGHIQGSNHVDSAFVYQIPKKIDNPDQEIWIFCRTQHRASYVASMLYNYGYRNVYLVEGGIVKWIEKGYPLVNQFLGDIKVIQYRDKTEEQYAFRDRY